MNNADATSDDITGLPALGYFDSNKNKSGRENPIRKTLKNAIYKRQIKKDNLMTKRKAIIFALLFAAAAGICATDSGKKVYIADTGKKYHLKDCRTLKKSKHLTELTVKDAKAKGYTACKVCNPGE